MVEMPDKISNEIYPFIIDNLNVMGVDIELDELKNLDKYSKKEAINVVRNIKTKILVGIEKSCGSKISDWFELNFYLWLLGTTPEAIPTFEGTLKELSMRIGYPESDLLNIVKDLKKENYRQVLKKFMETAFDIIDNPNIFISYANEDHELAEEFAELLTELKIKTFVANIDILPGTDWYNKLRDEIHKADELLLIVSPKSVNSSWVMIEIGAAWALGKRITPALLYENVDDVPEPIKRFQAQKIITISQRRKLVEIIAQRNKAQNDPNNSE